MSELIAKYFAEEGGQVAIYDANNTTIAERGYLRETCAKIGVCVTPVLYHILAWAAC